MPIEFRCPHCQTLLQTPDDAAGREAVCPECALRMEVPYVSCSTARDPSTACGYAAPPPPEPLSAKENLVFASLFLSLASFGFTFFSCCCIFGAILGFLAAMAGLVLGILGLNSKQRTLAIVGIAFNGLGVVSALLAGILTLVFAAHAPVRPPMP